jgi:hypothetical protein
MAIPQKLPVLQTSLPHGHHHFPDCLRETWTRWILWTMTRKNTDTWFVSLSFKKETGRQKAFGTAKAWLRNLEMSYFHQTGNDRLRWILVEGWQMRMVIHYHLLVMGEALNVLSRKRWEHRWKSLTSFTDNAVIHNAEAESAPYLAMHIRESGDVQWGGWWQGLKTPKSLACCDTATT